jgi:hypothetical protein
MRKIHLVSCLLLGGCMLANMGASKRLSEAVNQMSRSTRWGQMAEAAHMVDPSFRPLFMRNHRGWGQTIQVADTEVVHIELAPDSESALALISYEWYLPDTLTLHQTVVRQRWSRLGSGYTLISEAVVQGDGRLLGGNAVVAPEPSPDDATLGLAD